MSKSKTEDDAVNTSSMPPHPDHWWSRKPKEERRPILSSRLLLNIWEFRHPGKVLLAAAMSVILLAALVSVIMVAARDSNEEAQTPTWDVQVTGDSLTPFAPGGNDEAIGQSAPVARGTSPSGGPIDIGGPRGTSSVVIFVTGWDPHSPGILPAAQVFAERSDDLEVTVVASMTGESDANYPKPWLDDNGWRGRTLVDNNTDDVLNAYGISGLPSTVVIDEEGSITARIAGGLDTSALESLISSAQISVAWPPQELAPSTAVCSSQLPPYSCENLIDGYSETPWNDDSLKGVGAEIVFRFDRPVSIEVMRITNLPDVDAFHRNYRVRGYQILADDASVLVGGELADTQDAQEVAIGGAQVTSLTLRVTSTYEAETWDGQLPFLELAIGEITLYGNG